jgi:gag-polypeptide of LTR copia-type
MTTETASEIWAELEHVHQSTGFTTRMGLKCMLWKMKMKDGQRMASWIADVRGVAFQLSQLGVSTPNEDLILALTNGLPPAYDNFILRLDSTPSDIFSLNYVIGHLRTEETRLHGDVTCHPNDQALAITSQDRPKRTGLAHITCFGCGQKGHYQANCPTAQSTPMPAQAAGPT